MMIRSVLRAWLVMSCATSLHADPDLTVNLQITTVGSIPNTVVPLAKLTVEHVLRHAGVTVRWKRSNEPRSSKNFTCMEGNRTALQILVKERAEATEHPGAVGYTILRPDGERHIVVFYNRAVGALPLASPRLLGYAIAHEIGHALTPNLNHSPSGLMRARWDLSEYALMQGQLLYFSPEEGRAIQGCLSEKGHIRLEANR